MVGLDLALALCVSSVFDLIPNVINRILWFINHYLNLIQIGLFTFLHYFVDAVSCNLKKNTCLSFFSIRVSGSD